MANPNFSTFLGSVHEKLTKQMENSDFYSVFHNSTVTTNLFKNLDMLPEIHLEYGIKCFPQFGYG